jgi:hypothetical protein
MYEGGARCVKHVYSADRGALRDAGSDAMHLSSWPTLLPFLPPDPALGNLSLGASPRNPEEALPLFSRSATPRLAGDVYGLRR